MNYCLPLLKRLNFRLLLGLLLIFGSSSAQQNFLEVPVKLEIEKGDMSEVVIKVKKDGKDAFTQSGASKMRFKLDYNKKYTLVFTKPGYITKTIEFNTAAPSARITNGFEPYKIGIKLFLQNEENMVTYNQPVAQIRYDQNLDEFNFETDYSKSILSAISRDNSPEPPAPVPAPTTTAAKSTEGNESAPVVNPATTAATEEDARKKAAAIAEEEANKKRMAEAMAAEEERKKQLAAAQAAEDKKPEAAPATGLDTPPVTNPATGNEQPPTAIAQQAIDTPTPVPAPSQNEENDKKMLSPGTGSEEQKPVATSSGNENPGKKSAPVQSEERKKTSGNSSGEEKQKIYSRPSSGDERMKAEATPSMAAERPAEGPAFTESEKITREDFVEKNRIVTKIKVIKNGVLTEYSRVNYNWGGLYYFKNNTMSIPENLFVQWTGIRN